jgi:outer membrane protein assembly factor BamA
MLRLRPLVSGLSWVLGVCVLLGVAAVHAQTRDPVGQRITEVRVQQEGKPVTDRLIADLIDTKVGQPLSMQDVRESIDHLHGVGRFDDIQVSWEPFGAGIRVTYVLVPRHAVQAVEFRGTPELPERELR